MVTGRFFISIGKWMNIPAITFNREKSVILLFSPEKPPKNNHVTKYKWNHKGTTHAAGGK